MSDRFAGLRRVLRVRSITHDIDEELAYHFDESVAELMRQGMPRQQAEAEARRRFGNEQHYRRELRKLDRRMESNRRLEAWWQDLRYAVRRMGRWPGLTAAVVLTFALGIGANATMFGIIDRLLLRPPAHIVEPEMVKRLVVQRFLSYTGTGTTSDVLTHLDYVGLSAARSFASVAAFTYQDVTLGRGEEASRRGAVLATGEFFSLLGVRPALGHFWAPEEDRLGSPPVVVLAHQLWQQEFGSDPGVIGRTVDLGHGPYTVVGVAPRSFTGVDLTRVDLWLPLHAAGPQLLGEDWWYRTHNFWAFRVIGRLASGVTVAQADAELTTLLRQGRAEEIQLGHYPPDARVIAASVIAARGPLVSTEARVAKWLTGVSLIVLLIACANVANLLLARMIRQRREIGIRLALGISRRRLVLQAGTESVLLAAIGGASALIAAWLGGRFVRNVLLPDIVWGDAVVEPRVVALIGVLVLLAGLVSGLLPALQASRPDVLDTLRSGGQQTSAPASRTRSLLIVVQAAFAVVLLVGSGLFVTSLHRVHDGGLGLDPEGVLVVEPVFEQELELGRKVAFFREALERVPLLPAVEQAAVAQGLPFLGAMGRSIQVPGLDSLPRLPGGGPYFQVVSPDYFATLRLRVLRGRGFVSADVEDVARVVVVSETMARVLWPGGADAIGQCIVVAGEDASCTQVVGVVQDTRRFDPKEDEAMHFYLPWRRGLETVPQALLMRTSAEAKALVPATQRELLSLEPGLRFAQVRPYRELIDPRTRSWQLGATVFAVFGLLALVVAAMGLYSVLAFAVAQRTHELGIRAALGASRERLLGMVLGQGLRLVVIGTAAGLLIALVAGTRIQDLLFETSPRDPLVFGGVAVGLVLVAILASGLPAWRATRVDPSVALRTE